MDKTGVEMLMNNDLDLPRPRGVRVYAPTEYTDFAAINLTRDEADTLRDQLTDVLAEYDRLAAGFAAGERQRTDLLNQRRLDRRYGGRGGNQGLRRG
jgi:hypothetical protein